MAEKKILLSIIELGGYPDFTPLYQRLGYEVIIESKMRKVLKLLKRKTPDVVVAEFNFQSDFRDRTSTLESLMSVIERMPGTKTVIFYDKEYRPQLDRLQAHYRFSQIMPFPINQDELKTTLSEFYTR